MKIQLPDVTLFMADCVDPVRGAKVLEICKSKCDFGDVKLLTDVDIDYPHAVKIPSLKTLVAYSIFMLCKSAEYINTTHYMVVQRDGFILNADSWNPDWMQYDWISPLFVQHDDVGSGGMCLRSKRLMDAVARKLPDWDWTQERADIIQSQLGFFEDGVVCLSEHFKHFNFASAWEASRFSQGGNRNPAFFYEFPFSFHRTWQQIDFKTGRVDSSDLSKDLNASYHEQIDSLYE